VDRQNFIKDPDSGKRVARPDPASDWIVNDIPKLRIVDQELWDRLKARRQGLRRNQAFHEKQRPRRLLSFLLKCGVCGGGFSKVWEKHYGCSAAR
jgi:site-specific DNA recombinase